MSWNLRAAILLGAVVVAVAVAATTLRAPLKRSAADWTDPVTGITFVHISPATFQVGTPATEAGREAQEVRHEVRLTRPYYLAKHEVTQAVWVEIMGANPSQFNDCPTCPVERVSLTDVEAFLARLNARSGSGFRLPTEAEWEVACRCRGSAPFGQASSLGSLDANIDGNYPYDAPKGPARGRTTPAGSFPPNRWGLFDMSGNVWEWTSDWHCLYPEGTVTDPAGTCSSEYRVIRGGSWKFDGNSARCGLRYTHRPQDSGYSLGFRLAKDVL